ncbi:hypothetical protein [Peribacillus muralis]|uniref:hypothetical protein n=1 Tax=Peribacillus muralis TaxID=264697 RepID=UPI00366C202C
MKKRIENDAFFYYLLNSTEVGSYVNLICYKENYDIQVGKVVTGEVLAYVKNICA